MIVSLCVWNKAVNWFLIWMQNPPSRTAFGWGRVKLFCICSMHPCNPHRSRLLSPAFPTSLPPLFIPPPPLLHPPSFLPFAWPRAQSELEGGTDFLIFSIPAPEKKTTFRSCASRVLVTQMWNVDFLLCFRLHSRRRQHKLHLSTDGNELQYEAVSAPSCAVCCEACELTGLLSAYGCWVSRAGIHHTHTHTHIIY